MARSILHSVGKAGMNLPADVKVVQELINDNIGKLVPLRPLVVDGRIGPATLGAIEEFQRRVVKLVHPDGRVDPGGKTLARLNEGGQPVVPVPVISNFRVVFQHGGAVPEFKSSAGPDALYESRVSIVGGMGGNFRGSIYPDDMDVKGRIKDGSYDLYLGFHSRAGSTPSASDLVARDNGFRAALIVNNDQTVPVISNNAGKTTSSLIHVHNGYNSKRYSDGCPTLHPRDWPNFIKVFLSAFPRLGDWTAQNAYVGKKIGVLEVRA